MGELLGELMGFVLFGGCVAHEWSILVLGMEVGTQVAYMRCAT